eukprot:CFRG6194T1
MLSAFRKVFHPQGSPIRMMSSMTEAITDVNPSTVTVRNIRDRVLIEHLEDNEKIVFVTLNRPDKLNSLDLEMFMAISEAAQDLMERKGPRVAILRGNGRAFCTGLDVKTMMKSPTSPQKLLVKPAGTPNSNLAQDVSYLWRQLPIPVIGSLHGMVFGGGLQLALGADFRFATPDCKMSIMEAKWGLIPDMGITVAARELMRADILKELTMTARVFSGVEGKEYGVVTRTTETPVAEALKLAEEICDKSPDMVAASKNLFNQTHTPGSDKEALNLETDLQRQLMFSYNQFASVVRTLSQRKLPYTRGPRKSVCPEII